MCGTALNSSFDGVWFVIQEAVAHRSLHAGIQQSLHIFDDFQLVSFAWPLFLKGQSTSTGKTQSFATTMKNYFRSDAGIAPSKYFLGQLADWLKEFQQGELQRRTKTISCCSDVPEKQLL